MSSDSEALACIPEVIKVENFNPNCDIPYGCDSQHIHKAMQDFIDFLGFINQQLYERSLNRLETMLMPANFSSLVGEFMHSSVTKHCHSLVKNQYHNGHPDLIPAGYYDDDSILHGDKGIEIKASRYKSGWQGHNAEDVWLMVFVFDSNRPSDKVKGVESYPFKFVSVVGAHLTKGDWSESGRNAGSRRTPTASVLKIGRDKMMNNWIYHADI